MICCFQQEQFREGKLVMMHDAIVGDTRREVQDPSQQWRIEVEAGGCNTGLGWAGRAERDPLRVAGRGSSSSREGCCCWREVELGLSGRARGLLTNQNVEYRDQAPCTPERALQGGPRTARKRAGQ